MNNPRPAECHEAHFLAFSRLKADCGPGGDVQAHSAGCRAMLDSKRSNNPQRWHCFPHIEHRTPGVSGPKFQPQATIYPLYQLMNSRVVNAGCRCEPMSISGVNAVQKPRSSCIASACETAAAMAGFNSHN